MTGEITNWVYFMIRNHVRVRVTTIVAEKSASSFLLYSLKINRNTCLKP